jgi:peptidoglycan/LPS O-acetylase OafA/YrhL
LISAWLALETAAIFALTEQGIPPGNAVLLAAVANILFALILYSLIRRKSRHLRFSATTNSLKPLPASQGPSE